MIKFVYILAIPLKKEKYGGSETMEILFMGFILGMKHALDADHVVAVSTIITRTKSIYHSARVGAFWGLGHTATLVLVGMGILLFRITLPPRWNAITEFTVGAMLILLGFVVLIQLIREKIHGHYHVHKGKHHFRFHYHNESSEHNHLHGKSFLAGTVHGLAGSAGLMLLVLSTIPFLLKGVFYILIFSFGTILGMAILGVILKIPFKIRMLNRFLTGLVGVSSIAFGIKFIFENMYGL